MFLEEFEHPVTTVTIHNLLREHFDYELPVGNLTVEKAQIVLEEICIRIDNFRKSNDYYLGERNARYLSMLATANFLTEFLKDKAVLVEALPTNSSAYHAGMGKGIAHGVDTAGSFVPHVAGSAIGAFMGGLKGQALQSDAGRVKIANVDLENDMKGLNPKNPAQVKDFFQKQLKKHFSEYDTVQQGNILTYMTGIYQAGVDNKNTSENDIAAGLKTIPGNPFEKDIDPTKRKVLVDYFFSIYNKAKGSAKDSANPQAKPEDKKTPPTQEMHDVLSALENLKYSKKDAQELILQVVNKDHKLATDFDGLFRAVQAVNRK
jgi:hypothetical protein